MRYQYLISTCRQVILAAVLQIRLVSLLCWSKSSLRMGQALGSAYSVVAKRAACILLAPLRAEDRNGFLNTWL